MAEKSIVRVPKWRDHPEPTLPSTKSRISRNFVCLRTKDPEAVSLALRLLLIDNEAQTAQSTWINAKQEASAFLGRRKWIEYCSHACALGVFWVYSNRKEECWDGGTIILMSFMFISRGIIATRPKKAFQFDRRLKVGVSIIDGNWAIIRDPGTGNLSAGPSPLPASVDRRPQSYLSESAS